MNAKDKLILKTLQDRKQVIESELKELIRINEYNSLSRAIVSRERSNKALHRYIISEQKDKRAYAFAELWDKVHKKMMNIEHQKDIVRYADKRVSLEIELSDISSELYYRSKK